MSVHYTLNKKIKIKDLKEKGFEIKTSDKENQYPIVIGSHRYYDKGSWVGVLFLNTYDDIDEVETSELEGHSGYAVIYEICETFNAKFITDTYIDTKILDAQLNKTEVNITEEDFDECMKVWSEGEMI